MVGDWIAKVKRVFIKKDLDDKGYDNPYEHQDSFSEALNKGIQKGDVSHLLGTYVEC